jgi:hypothetical protein
MTNTDQQPCDVETQHEIITALNNKYQSREFLAEFRMPLRNVQSNPNFMAPCFLTTLI